MSTPTTAVLDRVLDELAAAGRDPDTAHAFAELVRSDPSLLHRDGGPRHLTASAIVVDRDAAHVALVLHRKGGFWVQPGGHVDPGDDGLEAAARREVAEETGLVDLDRVGGGPAVLHRHGLAAAFGTCAEHWDVQYLLRTRRPAREEPLRGSAEAPRVRWVPWPREAAGAVRSTAQLPPGTVPDLAGTLDVLSPLLP